MFENNGLYAHFLYVGIVVTGKFSDKIKELLNDEVAGLGYELWGCIYTPAKNSSLLRILIEKPGGVTLDDCEKVARHISAVLDVEDPITNRYRLEVSSPGLDRPLFELSHYQRFIGRKIKLRLHLPIDGQRNFAGSIVSADNDENIVVADGEREVCVSLSQIDRANLEPEI